MHEHYQEEKPFLRLPLLRAIAADKTDDGACVRILLKAGADPRVMAQDSDTPLGLSTILKQKNLVKIFLDYGVDVNDPVNATGLTSLIRSVANKNEELTKLLLAAGADPNITDLYGISPLMTAAKDGNLGTIETLLPLTTNLNNQSIDAKTALYMAAEKGHQAIVEALLDAGSRDPTSRTWAALSFYGFK